MKIICFILGIILCLNFSYSKDMGTKGISSKYSTITKLAVRTIGDDRDIKLLYFQAMELFNYEYYNDALPIFLKLLALDKNNCNFNFYVGVCYLKSCKIKTMGLPYLLKAVNKVDIGYNYSFKETSAPIHTYLYLGEVLMLNYKFDDAIRNFNIFKTYLTDKPRDVEIMEVTNHNIETAIAAKEYSSKPLSNVSIKPLDIVNSDYSDYSLIPSLDQKTYYFSSKRKGNTGAEQDPIDGFFDDIYYVQNINNKWSKPKKMINKINTVNLDALACFSFDQKTIYFYRLLEGAFDIYYFTDFCKTKGGSPQKMEGINSNSNETNACFSSDGNTFYFVSDRADSYGGTDIYMSEKMLTGEWSMPKNLGASVNTKYDEDFPFISSDDATLYFSSKGHKSMGGFDIFSSTLHYGTWSEPENIGYPINTAFDDVSFYLLPNGKKAFYSTAKKGIYGELDVYEIIFTNNK